MMNKYLNPYTLAEHNAVLTYIIVSMQTGILSVNDPTTASKTEIKRP